MELVLIIGFIFFIIVSAKNLIDTEDKWEAVVAIIAISFFVVAIWFSLSCSCHAQVTATITCPQTNTFPLDYEKEKAIALSCGGEVEEPSWFDKLIN